MGRRDIHKFHTPGCRVGALMRLACDLTLGDFFDKIEVVV